MPASRDASRLAPMAYIERPCRVSIRNTWSASTTMSMMTTGTGTGPTCRDRATGSRAGTRRSPRRRCRGVMPVATERPPVMTSWKPWTTNSTASVASRSGIRSRTMSPALMMPDDGTADERDGDRDGRRHLPDDEGDRGQHHRQPGIGAHRQVEPIDGQAERHGAGDDGHDRRCPAGSPKRVALRRERRLCERRNTTSSTTMRMGRPQCSRRPGRADGSRRPRVAAVMRRPRSPAPRQVAA